MVTEAEKLEAEIEIENEGLLDEVAMRIPTILNWNEFLEFREEFIDKFQELLELRSKIKYKSE